MSYEEHATFLKDMASEYLRLIDTGEGDPVENLKALNELLSRFSLATVNLTRPGKWEESDDYVVPDESEIRKSISERFPSFGMYNSVVDVVSNVGVAECGVNDSVDDILDIYKELHHSVWCFNKLGATEGVNYMISSFYFHWGRHLCDLQLYLHEIAVAT